MELIRIKPLSVNKARQGKRFKTKDYKEYEKIVLMLLRPIEIPKGKLRIDYIFWFSSKQSDIDNPTKLIQDIICKKYGFNDKMIYEITIQKKIVPRGKEFIGFQISKCSKN